MIYRAFLDDVRDPACIYPNDSGNWTIFRSAEDMLDFMKVHGWPNYISFDHDLGPDDVMNGHDAAKVLVDLMLDEKFVRIPFAWHVHSANPVGRANIQGLLNNFQEFCNSQIG